MLIGSKKPFETYGGLAKGLPAIAGAKAIVSLYRDARGFIGESLKKPNTFYLISILTWHRMIPFGRMSLNW